MRVDMSKQSKELRAERAARNKTIDQSEIEKSYASLGTIERVAEIFNLTWWQVYHRLPQELRAKNSHRSKHRYACVENFFSTDTPESMYVAGFIAADGCLHEGRRGKSGKHITIKLKSSDREILEKIVALLEFEGRITETTSPPRRLGDPETRCASVSISSVQIFDDLVRRFGLGPRKSLTMIFPERLTGHPLVSHFLRGYWDGDGTVGRYLRAKGSKRKDARCSLRGTPDFLLAVSGIFEKNAVAGLRKEISMDSNQGRLTYVGNKIVPSIRDFLYKDSTIWLQRKRDIFFDSQAVEPTN